MPEPTNSPAVRSLILEQAEQKKRGNSLDEGLEETFPASDPVSASHTTVALTTDEFYGGRYPLVDEALRSVSDRGEHEGDETVKALRQDAARFADRTSEIASGAAYVARSEVRSALSSVEGSIRSRPLTAVAIMAGLAYLFGATR